MTSNKEKKKHLSDRAFMVLPCLLIIFGVLFLIQNTVACTRGMKSPRVAESPQIMTTSQTEPEEPTPSDPESIIFTVKAPCVTGMTISGAVSMDERRQVWNEGGAEYAWDGINDVIISLFCAEGYVVDSYSVYVDGASVFESTYEPTSRNVNINLSVERMKSFGSTFEVIANVVDG